MQNSVEFAAHETKSADYKTVLTTNLMFADLFLK